MTDNSVPIKQYFGDAVYTDVYTTVLGMSIVDFKNNFI